MDGEPADTGTYPAIEPPATHDRVAWLSGV
jgi:hypothetical protein